MQHVVDYDNESKYKKTFILFKVFIQSNTGRNMTPWLKPTKMQRKRMNMRNGSKKKKIKTRYQNLKHSVLSWDS